jgi:arylsulfatase A-like enzyme
VGRRSDSGGGDRRPNLLFIMVDGPSAHTIGAYGSRLNTTPGIDRIGAEGMRFDACFCTNSLCSPSRATILTGTYNHINGVTTNSTFFDARQPTFPAKLREAGYGTYLVGKWHLGHGGIHDPVGFDRWSVLPDQGLYHDPEFLEPGRRRVVRRGYATDIITDLALEWLSERDRSRPFAALVQHKAPHRSWEPARRHAGLFPDGVAEPPTLRDDYDGRGQAVRAATMRVATDLTEEDVKGVVPPGLDADEELRWRYQRFIGDYLRCVAALDESVSRLLDWLDDERLAEDTVVVYTSDQGFFLGDHGWFDKRFMYEESLRMPLLVRYPREIPAGSTCDAIVLNLDFAPTFLDLAGVPVPDHMQGRSLRSLLCGAQPADWRTSFYYRYWVNWDSQHHVAAHYGIRTRRHKLVYYYADPCDQPGAEPAPLDPEWELFDLETDPFELRNVYADPAYRDVVVRLTDELRRAQAAVGDTDCAPVPEPALPATVR